MRKNLAVKMALIKKGLSQRELAITLGISENRLSRIVCGVDLPSPDLARKIGEALGMGFTMVRKKR